MAHKYGAVQCREQYRDCPHGHASLKEHRRWQELVLLEKAGEIRNLQQQVPFKLAAEAVLDGRTRPAPVYVADFVYEKDGGWLVVEDAKGMATPVFKLKRHLMKVEHGIEVVLS